MNRSVLILDNLHPSAGSLIKEAGYSVEISGSLSGQDLHSTLQKHEVVIIRSATQLDTQTIKSAPDLKLIGRAGVGTDNIDLKMAKSCGVNVINAPSGNTNAVAEHTFALILSLCRNIVKADQGIRTTKWLKKECQGHEIRGKTLGVVGAGRVGRQVIHIAQAMGMKCLATDPYASEEAAQAEGWSIVSLDSLQERSDIISLHIPSTKDGQYLVDSNFLKKMKKGSFLINTARGNLIDEDALAESLETNHLAGAALDVFSNEPLIQSPLIKSNNCILTPHIAASTHEAQEAVAIDIASQVIHFLQTGKTTSSVI